MVKDVRPTLDSIAKLVKAAEAVLAALNADKPPLRLALGKDAADNIAASIKTARAELSDWESVSRGTDFLS